MHGGDYGDMARTAIGILHQDHVGHRMANAVDAIGQRDLGIGSDIRWQGQPRWRMSDDDAIGRYSLQRRAESRVIAVVAPDQAKIGTFRAWEMALSLRQIVGPVYEGEPVFGDIVLAHENVCFRLGSDTAMSMRPKNNLLSQRFRRGDFVRNVRLFETFSPITACRARDPVSRRMAETAAALKYSLVSTTSAPRKKGASRRKCEIRLAGCTQGKAIP